MHRPKLYKSLTNHLSENHSVVDIIPSYENQILFKATLRDSRGWDIEDAVCVSSTHPMAMYEEDGSGEPTWWWQSDMLQQ